MLVTVMKVVVKVDGAVMRSRMMAMTVLVMTIVGMVVALPSWW